MKAPRTSDLLAENADLRARLAEAQELLEAMRSARVDTPLGAGPTGQTEHNAHEEELRRLNRELDNVARRRTAELQALMDALPVGVSFSDDSTCQRITGNPAVLAQFEVSPADNLSASAPAANAPGRQVRFFRDGQPVTDSDLPLQRAVAENREIPPMELEVQLPSGRRWFAQASAAPVRDPEGKVIGGVAVTEDVTERKRVELALRESERLYRAIGESIDYGVWVCAPDGRNTYASPSFLKLVGLTQEQCSNFGWGDVLHPDDAARTIAAWKECVRTGGTWDIEHRFRGVDGQWHPILARGVPVRDEQDRVVCWAGINLDVSRLKQTEAEAKCHADQLRAANEELTRFNQAMVGRELRMLELKQEINALCAQLGQPPRYQPQLDHAPKPPST
jgi:PAS domain S-box-containing protein